MLLKILLVMFIRINFVYSCAEYQSEVTETSYVSGEYLDIFKTIPAFFEYVLDVIIHKPEMLEKDDVTVFTEDATVMFDDIADVKHTTVNFDSDTGEDEQSRFDLFWDWYPGFGAKRLELSPSEVAEKTLEVERQLEEYNDNIRKT